MFKDQLILICPLNWGIGHATRMVAYAKQLERDGNRIFVAGAERVLTIFEEEMPNVERFPLKDIEVHYAHSNKTIRRLFFRIPVFLFSFIREHILLKRLLRDHQFDVVISDNRFALWNKHVRSYYVTHQLSIKLTDGWHWAEGVASIINQWFISHYDACLVPDVEGAGSLSGELSLTTNPKIKVKHIGWLSRFVKPSYTVEKENYSLLILSGVEPHRSYLKEAIMQRFKATGEPLIIAGGDKAETVGNIITLPYVRTEALMPLMLSAKHIICRSGYSMLTDLKVLGCDAELIPTPGQPEQEYLGKLHAKGQ